MIKKTPFYTLLFCAFLFVSTAFVKHDFYISTTMIDHNPKTEQLEVTFKLFTDDFERVLDDVSGQKTRLGTEKEHQKIDELIGLYLEKHIRVLVGDKVMEMNYLGKEDEMDITWCYAEIDGVNSVKDITVSNSLFVEQIEEQKNIVQVKVNKRKRSLLFTRQKTEGTLNFE